MPNTTSKQSPVTLYCRSCPRSTKSKAYKGTLYHNSYPSPKITSRSLTLHIRYSSKHGCLDHYRNNGLVEGDKYDYSTSLLVGPTQSTICHTTSQLGLTLTGNGPVPNLPSQSPLTTSYHVPLTSRMHLTLNQQVIHQAFQPRINRATIQSHISVEQAISVPGHVNNNYSSDEDNDFPNNPFDTGVDEGHDVVLNPPDQPPAIGTKVNKLNDRKLTQSVQYGESTLSGQLASEIGLMMIIAKHKLPLNIFNIIHKWAQTCQSRDDFSFSDNAPPRKRQKIFREIREDLGLPGLEFQPHLINWLPDDKPIQVYVRSFSDAIYSLLTNQNIMREENLSFPDSTSPLSPTHNPPLSDKTEISELHHGQWWTASWKEACDPNLREILVPIVLYMDGISLDTHGRLTLTPLNMTLGIFNVATRAKPEAWETIYFHPDTDFESARHSKKPTPHQSLQNLHKGVEKALESFKEEMDTGLLWDYLPFNGQYWKVKMKFAIAYVIGDTELHDKLCGKYGSRTAGVSKLCRHCNCPTSCITHPAEQQNATLWKPSDFCAFPDDSRANLKQYFKDISHHHINNAFHPLNFGSFNPHGIHLATPGECLHMHQLGAAKRAVESFNQLIQGKVPWDPDNCRGGGGVAAYEKMGYMAQRYGAFLSRQSDRNFPRSKSNKQLLHHCKKNGGDYAGVLISLLIAIVSKQGKQFLSNHPNLNDQFFKKEVLVLELILSMEEFLKHGKITKSDLTLLPKTMIYFINAINSTCKRAGMGTQLIKNHLYFHIPKYIAMWGPPTGWDSAPSESHHKTEIKAPSKNTQRNASTLIYQTAVRQTEYRDLLRATTHYQMNNNGSPSHNDIRPKVAGAMFNITKDAQGQATMEWKGTQNKSKPFFPQDVLQFCCDKVLPILTDTSQITGFTEHNRHDRSTDTTYLFRSHPCYRSDTGQVDAVWMDWALFQADDMKIPCQILCFVVIKELNNGPNMVQGYDIQTPGNYAVVRRMESETEVIPHCNFVRRGRLMGGLFLYDTEAIVSEIAVVPDLEENGQPGLDFLTITNRSGWLDYFGKKNKSMDAISYQTLYDQCTMPVVDVHTNHNIENDVDIDVDLISYA